MCEIQIIQKLGKEKITKMDIGEFFKMMCFGSMHNNDAFGVFNHKYIVKKNGSFNASKLNENKLMKNNFIVGHNRFSTGWSKIENVYDVEDEDKRIDISLNKSTNKIYPATWNWSCSILDNMTNIFLPTRGFRMPIIKEGYKKYREKIVTYNKMDINRNNHENKFTSNIIINTPTPIRPEEVKETRPG